MTNSLIIDATTDKIFLAIISDKNIYTKTHKNSKSNFDKLTIFINELLKKNKVSIDEIKKIYVNRGPGSFAGIRNSISIVKGIHLSKKIDYICFSFLDFKGKKNIDIKSFSSKTSEKIKNLKEIPRLCNKYKIVKNFVKPIYKV